MGDASRDASVDDALPWRLRHPLVASLVASLTAVVLFVLIAVVADHRTSHEVSVASRDRVRSNRDAAVRALERQSQDYVRAASALAAARPVSRFLRAPGPDASDDVQRELQTLALSQGSPAAFVTDLDGRTRAVYPAQDDLIGQDFSFRDWFAGVSASGEPYVSEGYRSAATGHPFVVAVAAPVVSGARRLGYVTFLWELDSVRSIADGAKADDGIAITVTDQRGQDLVGELVVDSRGQAQTAAVSSTTARALQGRTSSTTTGGQVLEAAPVSSTGWTVTATLPVTTAMEPSVAFRRTMLWTLLVALLLVLGATARAYWVGRRRAADARVAVSERRKLRDSEERFRRVFDEGLTGKVLAGPTGEILQVNETMASLLGTSAASLVGRPLLDCLQDKEDRDRVAALLEDRLPSLRGEMQLVRHDTGELLWGLVAMTWMTEQSGERVLLVQVEDVTGRRAAEQQLTTMALHDELTGLPNRRLLLERCEHAFATARAGRGESPWVSLLFIDLDGFKAVNDWAGHDAGDQMLVAIGRDLRATVRPGDTVARIGGDEFVVLLERDTEPEELHDLATRLIEAVRRPVATGGLAVTVSASVGIASVDLSAEPHVRPDQLIDRADAAMYRAKQRGKDRHDVFDRQLRDTTEARRSLEQAVREGLHDDRISLVFQPVVDVDAHSVVGAEALMRLRDDSGRLLPTLPSVIAAETAGLSERLSDCVMRLALDAARHWPTDLTVAVNVSARELTGRGLRARVLAALETVEMSPARLVLEVTETSILNAGRSALDELELLRKEGVRVAIDDFGTAYATLQSLTTLPVDILKVDASFTAGLPAKRAHSAVVHGIASMAAELAIPCIVEGVETAEQLDAIRGMGVLAQGWWWGMPAGADRVPSISVTTPKTSETRTPT